MKAKLLENLMGKTAGSVFEVTRKGIQMSTIKDSGGETNVPTAALEFEAEEQDSFARTNEVVQVVVTTEEPPARLEVSDDIEAEARAMYDDYTAAVGGKAFNGDDLPPASEFFEDPSKQRQANAWRTVAGLSETRLFEKLVGPVKDIEVFEDPNQAVLPLDVVEEVKASEDNDIVEADPATTVGTDGDPKIENPVDESPEKEQS